MATDTTAYSRRNMRNALLGSAVNIGTQLLGQAASKRNERYLAGQANRQEQRSNSALDAISNIDFSPGSGVYELENERKLQAELKGSEAVRRGDEREARALSAMGSSPRNMQAMMPRILDQTDAYQDQALQRQGEEKVTAEAATTAAEEEGRKQGLQRDMFVEQSKLDRSNRAIDAARQGAQAERAARTEGLMALGSEVAETIAAAGGRRDKTKTKTKTKTSGDVGDVLDVLGQGTVTEDTAVDPPTTELLSDTPDTAVDTAADTTVTEDTDVISQEDIIIPDVEEDAGDDLTQSFATPFGTDTPSTGLLDQLSEYGAKETGRLDTKPGDRVEYGERFDPFSVDGPDPTYDDLAGPESRRLNYGQDPDRLASVESGNYAIPADLEPGSLYEQIVQDKVAPFQQAVDDSAVYADMLGLDRGAMAQGTVDAMDPYMEGMDRLPPDLTGQLGFDRSEPGDVVMNDPVTGERADTGFVRTDGSRGRYVFEETKDGLTPFFDDGEDFAQGGYIGADGGLTEGEYDHDINKKAIVDEETGEKEGEATGGEFILPPYFVKAMEELIEEGHYAEAGMLYEQFTSADRFQDDAT